LRASATRGGQYGRFKATTRDQPHAAGNRQGEPSEAEEVHAAGAHGVLRHVRQPFLQVAVRGSDEDQIGLLGFEPPSVTAKAFRLIDRRGLPNVQQAAELFRRALAKNPAFAPAHAGTSHGRTIEPAS
jgi:hypothetical protein